MCSDRHFYIIWWKIPSLRAEIKQINRRVFLDMIRIFYYVKEGNKQVLFKANRNAINFKYEVLFV